LAWPRRFAGTARALAVLILAFAVELWWAVRG
jgi:hypothetical protein